MIRLSDEETLNDYYQDTGKVVDSVSFEVDEVKKFTPIDTISLAVGDVHFQITTLKDSNLIVYKKTIDEFVDYGVYELSDVPLGNRKDLIENGFDFIFEGTEDSSFSDYNILTYGDEIQSEDYLFKKINDTGLYEYDGYVSLITEYKSDTDDVRMMIVEIGGEDSDEGGLIFVYCGGLVREEEIEWCI